MRNGSLVRARDEGGAVAVMLALTICFIFVPLAALVVDIGVQRVAVRDLQSVADLVALDVARKLDGSTTVAQWATHDPSLQELADQSLDRNRTIMGEDVHVTPVLGRLDAAGDFEELPANSTEVPGAVSIRARGSVDFHFSDGDGAAERSAVGVPETSACFQLGSFAAAVNAADSAVLKDIIAPLIGSSTLTAVGYRGLATTRLSLLDLVRTNHIGVGTVHELLQVDDLTVADLYRASATVLRAQGKLAQAQVFDLAAVSVVAPVQIAITDLIGLSTAPDAALHTQFNALDLLLGAAFLANGDNLLDVHNLQASLDQVGVTTTQLRVIERAQRACNDDVAKTAQLKLYAEAKVLINSSPLYKDATKEVRLLNNDNQISTFIEAELAGATGRLTDASCTPTVFEVDVQPDLMKLTLEGRARLSGTLDVSVLGLGIVKLGVTFDAVLRTAVVPSSAQMAPQHATVAIPPRTWDQPVQIGSTQLLGPVTTTIDDASIQVNAQALGLLGITTAQAKVLLAPLFTATVNEMTVRAATQMNELTAKVNDIVLQVGNMLGVRVAGADVYGLPYPNCGTPVLRG